MGDRRLYTFSDVLIEPRFSTIKSRRDVDLTTTLGDIKLHLPIISANMSTITGEEMALVMAKNGGMGILHRFMSIEDNVEMWNKVFMSLKNREVDTGGNINVGVSIGISDEEKDRAVALYDDDAFIFCIDVAHGAQMSVVKQVKWMREKFKDNVFIIVGNFATSQSINDFVNHAGGRSMPDAFKIGIGPGCLAAGTRILMANGTYKNIEDIKLHDRVINQNGDAVSVIGTKFSGYKKVVKYKSNLWYDYTYATPDHKHFVGNYSGIKDINQCVLRVVLDKRTRSGKSKYSWEELGTLKNHTFLMPKNIKFELSDSFSIKLSDFFTARRSMSGFREDTNLTIEPSYELGYVFGTFLGDGHSSISKSIRSTGRLNTSALTTWYFGLQEQYISDKLVKCLKSTLKVEASTKKSKNMTIVILRNNFISRFFKSFGTRTNKHLPEQYLCNNKDYLKGILDGLVDSDGYYKNDGRVCFSNTSRKLVELFNFVFFQINNYFPSQQYKTPSAGGLKNCLTDNCNPSYVSRGIKNPTFNMTKDHYVNRIIEIQDESELLVPTYDLQVDCNTHSFIANHMIVHNSTCTTRVKTGVGVSQLSAILDCSHNTSFPIIADGGMRTPGDISKALAAGAKAVMLGGMLAGTNETPGSFLEKNSFESAVLGGPWDKFKKYKGSASEGYGNGWKTSEGVEFLVPSKGPVEVILKDIEGGLRSAFTYTGSSNITQFRNNAKLILVSQSTIIENGPHGAK